MTDVTQIFSQIEQGDPNAAEHLLPLVYDELRKLAAAKLAQEKPGQTLQATALVHEAYVRLVGGPHEQSWENRGHFFAAAGEAMRRILVEQARRKSAQKAGGEFQRVELSLVDAELPQSQPDILALHEALARLEVKDPRAAQLVKLRFFVGMTVEQAAQILGISVSTAKTDWTYAKIWLRAEMLDVSPRNPCR